MKSLQVRVLLPLASLALVHCFLGGSDGSGGTPKPGPSRTTPLPPLAASYGSLCTLTDGGAPSGSGFVAHLSCGSDGSYAYNCPTMAAVTSSPDDVVPCTPTDSTRGKVGLGQPCTSELLGNATGNTSLELSDDCAPMAVYADARNPKGTVCIAQVSVGSTNSENIYCTHSCRTDSDCVDIVISGEQIRCDLVYDQCDYVTQ